MAEKTYREQIEELTTAVVRWGGEHLFAHKGEALRLAAEADEALARANAEIAVLKAECAANKRDAERYRWLRESIGSPTAGAHPMADQPPFCVFGKFDTDRHVTRYISGANLDAAIDAEITGAAK